MSATDRDSLTITIGLRKLAETFGHQERNLGLKMAGAWVGGIPILIFYFISSSAASWISIRLTSGFKVGITRQEGIVSGDRNRPSEHQTGEGRAAPAAGHLARSLNEKKGGIKWEQLRSGGAER